MTNSIMLKPCPFCGEHIDSNHVFGRRDHLGYEVWLVKCWHCNARGPEALGEITAIEKWNINIKRQ